MTSRPESPIFLLLNRGTRLLDPAALSMLATALMLQPHYDLFSAALDTVDDGRIKVDDELVLKLISEYGAESHRIVTSAAFARVSPRRFHPAFARAWRRWNQVASLRSRLALTLEGFLGRRPAEAPRYRSLIRQLLLDSSHESVLRGLAMVRHLAPLREDELRRMIRHSRSRSWEKRVNLALGVQWLLESTSIPERAKKAALQGPLARALERLARDPHPDVRGAASTAVLLGERWLARP